MEATHHHDMSITGSNVVDNETSNQSAASHVTGPYATKQRENGKSDNNFKVKVE